MKIGLPVSVSVAFWSIVSLFRYFNDQDHKDARIFKSQTFMTEHEILEATKQVAICVPAHNEETVITKTIVSLKQLVPSEQIFVVSDGSTDQTARLARALDCQVLELQPGQGKAAALETLLHHFNLLKRFHYALIADADTVFDKDYLKNALPLFVENPHTAVVAAYTKTRWHPHSKLQKNMFTIAYRMKLYQTIQPLMMFGQTWRKTNTNPVVPGFACLYRTEILKQLKINIPGLIIEDFNMAFQIHKKNLGTIAHHPSVVANTQDPDNIKDYYNQIKRWNLGFFQTIKYYGVWPSLFWLSLGFFILEMTLFSLFTVLLPPATLLLFFLHFPAPFTPGLIHLLWLLLISVFFFDYLVTMFIAWKDRIDILSIYGLGFILMRYLDAIVYLNSIPKAIFQKSNGVWSSPTRR